MGGGSLIPSWSPLETGLQDQAAQEFALTQGLAGGFFTTEPPGEPKRFFYTRAFSYVQPLTLKVKVPYST